MAWVERIINKINTNSDDSWTWPPVERGKLNCFLCEKVITFFSGSTNEFFQHIENDHKIFINHGLLLSIIFLDNETLNEIRVKFRQNLNALKVTQDFEETLDGDVIDSHDDSSFVEDRYEFENNTSFTPKEDFLNKQIKEDEVLANVTVPKYKAGPKSYKIKQLYKNKQDRILSKLDDDAISMASLKCTVEKSHQSNENLKLKNILVSNSNLERSNVDQHIPLNFKIINEVLDTPKSKLSNYVKINETENVEPKSPEICLASPAHNYQFKSDDTKKIVNPPQDDNIHYKPGPKSRKIKQKLKEVNNEISKSQKKIEDEINMSKNMLEEDVLDNFVNCGEGEGIHEKDDVNSRDYNFIDNGGSKLDNLYLLGLKRKSYNPELVESYQVKRKKIEEPNTKMDEIKHMLKSSNKSSERLMKSSVEEQIKLILECDEFDGDNTLENREMKNRKVRENFGKAEFNHQYNVNNSVQSPANQLLEEEIKNILYFDILNEDGDKQTKSNRLTNPRKALDQDQQSFKPESDVPNSPHLKDIKYSSLSLNHEKIDSEHTKPSQSGRKYTINVEVSEYFLKRPNQLSGYNISESVKNQFINDLSLPDGWKIRRIWRENKKNYDTEYLSPDGRKARSKVAVIEYMKLMGIYCQQDYDKIIKNYEINHFKILT